MAASWSELISCTLEGGGSCLPVVFLGLRCFLVGALRSSDFAPPGLRPIARVRRPVIVLSFKDDTKCEKRSVFLLNVSDDH
jgi:hypothetical protein